MRRILLCGALIAVLCIETVGAADWDRAYERGLEAAEAKRWSEVAAQMRQAIAGRAEEASSLRIGRSLMPYLPWFWLGIALLEQNDVDGAIDALRRSERQKAIEKTSHYSELRAAVARAETLRRKPSASKIESLRSEADAAATAAVGAQLRATSAGAGRTEQYRDATRALQEAMALKKKDDGASLERSISQSRNASRLFDEAAAEAKEAASRRAVARPVRTDPPVEPKQEPTRPAPRAVEEIVIPEPLVDDRRAPEPVRTEPRPKPVQAAAVVPPRPPADAEVTVSEPKVQASTAVETSPPSPARESVRPVRERLSEAWRVYAAGDLDRAETLLSAILRDAQAQPEALLLRGSIRHAMSILRSDDMARERAIDDFRLALTQAPGARLDPRYFPPKTVELLEQARAVR